MCFEIMHVAKSEGNEVMTQAKWWYRKIKGRYYMEAPSNSGFIFLRSRNSQPQFLRYFMRTLVNTMPLMVLWDFNSYDQIIWNVLLKHERFRQVHFRVFPLDRIGILNSLVGVTNKTLTVHTVASKTMEAKKELLKKHGLWLI